MASIKAPQYPITDTVEVTDTYGTVTVRDPYRWLEADTAEKTKEWVKAQNKVTFDYLEQIPFRDRIKSLIEDNINYARYSVEAEIGDYILFQKNEGTQNQSVYYLQKGTSGQPELLIDPNTMSKDGTTSLDYKGHSEDNNILAFQINEAGSDWAILRFMDLKTKTFLPDTLKWVKFTGTTFADGGLYYCRYDAPAANKALSGINTSHKLCFHKLGTSQEQDVLVYTDAANPMRYLGFAASDDRKHQYLYISEGTSGVELRYRKGGGAPDAPFKTLVQGFAYNPGIIGNDGNNLLMQIEQDAPNGKIVKLDPNKPEPANWTTLVPEGKSPIDGAFVAGGKLFVNRLVDVTSELTAYQLDGTNPTVLQMPDLGTVNVLAGEASKPALYYQFTSYLYPGTIYKYDIPSNKASVLFAPQLKGFNPADYETKRVFVPSKDGTKVPLFITHKKGIVLDGTNPTLLYAYGGFNISIKPQFSGINLGKLKMGMVLANACLRGGGEYGENWHKAGMLLKKQNVFDDFIACANYLKAEKYTSVERLAIQGGSNGGLLVGAVMTQQPDLCKVAIPMVGVLDMLRYHKFTVGWGWMVEYGNPEDPQYFDYLYKYSPLHNLKFKTPYPATFITTADHDDRVVPAHSFKFAAMLQRCQVGPNPTLIRIETQAGHGGSSLTKAIELNTDILAFTLYNMGIDPFGE